MNFINDTCISSLSMQISPIPVHSIGDASECRVKVFNLRQNAYATTICDRYAHLLEHNFLLKFIPVFLNFIIKTRNSQ